MTLKQLTWRLTLPLTIILFSTVTKWWYVLPVDAPDTRMVGFPLPFAADAWHTSMSLQIFVIELLIDFLVYFVISFLIVFLINRYLVMIKIPVLLTRILWSLCIIIAGMTVWIFDIMTPYVTATREWDMRVLATGIKPTWAPHDRMP